MLQCKARDQKDRPVATHTIAKICALACLVDAVFETRFTHGHQQTLVVSEIRKERCVLSESITDNARRYIFTSDTEPPCHVRFLFRKTI